MIKHVIKIILISGLALGDHSFDKVGTTSAQFLKLGVGARAMGMGGGFVALADDGSAMYWNPAGMMNQKGFNTSFMHNDWALDISHDFVGVTFPAGRSGILGFSLTALSMDEQEVTTVLEPDGNGLTYTVLNMAFGVSYARQISDRFSYGHTVKIIRLSAYNEVANTAAIDIGMLLRTDFHGLKIGMCVSNFGGEIRYEGRDLIEKADIDDDLEGNYLTDVNLTTESWPLPLLIRIGVAIDLIGSSDPIKSKSINRLTVSLDAEHPNDSREHVNAGCEYSFKNIFFLRGGYRFNYDEENITFGAGLKLKLGALGETYINYGVKPFGPFGNINQVSIELQLK